MTTDVRFSKNFVFEMTPLRKVITVVLTALFRLIMDLRVEGTEHFPMDGPAIVAANHVTNFDVFPLQMALPRPLFFMAKAELFRNPLLDVLFRNLGAFPVYRGQRDEWALQHARRVLEYGAVLGMFPEGKRSKGRGLSVGKTGAARLAIEMRVPIVPVAIIGSDRFFKQFPRRTVVEVKILPPLLAGADESPLELTERLMYTLAAALPKEMRGVYGDGDGESGRGRG
ncbi:MAG: lysophospholipid acyltransferase family protein [Anaerolineales bacterium]